MGGVLVSESTGNDEAARWAVRLADAPLSADEQRQLDVWLQADPRHLGALVRARATWLNLGRLGALSGRASVGANSTAFAVASAAQAPTDEPSTEPGVRDSAVARVHANPALARPAQRWRGVMLLAASLAGLTLAFLGFRWVTLDGTGYDTGVGEVRRVALEDGSALTLNSNSRAIVRFQKKERTVKLLRGEALFEVAKDRSRPFVVHSGDVSVRAVGTAFAVRALPDDVVVSVTEGVVEVSEQQRPPQRVTVNEKAVVRPDTPVTITRQDAGVAQRSLSWRTGVLSFSGEPLAEAVREVNRYSTRQIEIADPTLGARPVIGIFKVGDVDAFAQAAAAALHTRMHVSGDTIQLSITPPEN
jgi:transmembrane sensor